MMTDPYEVLGLKSGASDEKKETEHAGRNALTKQGTDAASVNRQALVPPNFAPAIKGEWKAADLRPVLPPAVRRAFLEGMEAFGRIIPGFADDAVCLSGVESRTSSPVRIPRDETLQSAVRGLYPCGEGAGYAGGITSAAMDGLRVAEAIAARYQIPEKEWRNDGTVSE